MRAGTLRHRVRIEQLVPGSPAQNAGGEPEEAWAELTTRYAAVEPMKGRELLAAQQINSEVSTLIRMRSLQGVTSTMRAVYANRNYDILAVVNVDERARETLLYVREGPNNG